MSQTATCKLASVLLQYPTAALFDGLGELSAFAAATSPSRPGRLSPGSWPGCGPPRPPRSRSTTCRPSTCAAAAPCT